MMKKRLLSVCGLAVLALSPAPARADFESYQTRGPWTFKHDKLTGSCSMSRDTLDDGQEGAFGLFYTGAPNRYYVFAFEHPGLDLEPQKIKMRAKFGDLGWADWDGSGVRNILTVDMPAEKNAAVRSALEKASGKILHFDLMEEEGEHHILELGADGEFIAALGELMECSKRGPRSLSGW